MADTTGTGGWVADLSPTETPALTKSISGTFLDLEHSRAYATIDCQRPAASGPEGTEG